MTATTAATKEVTFGKPDELGDAESSTKVFVDGVHEATIEKTSVANPKFGRMADYYGEYVAGNYEVVFYGDEADDKNFDPADFASGARGALAAAKRYAREGFAKGAAS